MKEDMHEYMYKSIKEVQTMHCSSSSKTSVMTQWVDRTPSKWLKVAEYQCDKCNKRWRKFQSFEGVTKCHACGARKCMALQSAMAE